VEIELSKGARIAACSSFHFQRMFSYIAGLPLSEYLRRRRMTAAAFELFGGGVKVIDLAAKYGYDSPTAFCRAFQNVHGVPPSAARAEGVKLTAFPRITFNPVGERRSGDELSD
jgi:AraC family transcriptional regulator